MRWIGALGCFILAYPKDMLLMSLVCPRVLSPECGTGLLRPEMLGICMLGARTLNQWGSRPISGGSGTVPSIWLRNNVTWGLPERYRCVHKYPNHQKSVAWCWPEVKTTCNPGSVDPISRANAFSMGTGSCHLDQKWLGPSPVYRRVQVLCGLYP